MGFTKPKVSLDKMQQFKQFMADTMPDIFPMWERVFGPVFEHGTFSNGTLKLPDDLKLDPDVKALAFHVTRAWATKPHTDDWNTVAIAIWLFSKESRLKAKEAHEDGMSTDMLHLAQWLSNSYFCMTEY